MTFADSIDFISGQNKKFILDIKGRLDIKRIPFLWKKIRAERPGETTQSISIDLTQVDTIDSAGAAFVCYLETYFLSGGFHRVDIRTADSETRELLENHKKSAARKEKLPGLLKLSFIEELGKDTATTLDNTKTFISLVGEITWALSKSLAAPRRIRWKDTFIVAEKSGVNALPIVALISFIVGLVMAFQAAIPMRMFGAELYVADLIGIAMVRELGPLMTAIVLTGRSASAFAAEIGTMRINEEIDALTVMGLDPVQFLIVPRVIASTVTTPLLAIFSNLMGMLGGAVVITSLGYPVISYYNQIAAFVKWGDFAGGLVKCFVFGILIAVTGCIRGYQAQSGPSAVGDATTKAVVTGIILIAVFDGIFSIIYYYLGI